jgi:hypothetical protein
MGKFIGAVAMLLLPCAVAAAEDPETVYGKLHRATLAGNVEEVLTYASVGKRKEIASLPGKEDLVRMLAMSLPQTYSVTSKDVGARKAHLDLRGVHDASGPARGRAELIKEKGQWKVTDWAWDAMAAASEPQLVRVQASQAATTKAAPAQEPMKGEAPQDQKAPAAAATPETAALVPVEAPTLRRATADQMPCLIKPVMSDDDLRRCGANPPKYEDNN